ncbi:hypothetical protein [Methylogaea oryzae]|uniref:hypothetical protein n=1 Tax=Methylogaea oryzae TaxID=1295382 RepID=UPI00278BCC91|nr:hypothetical protein [Methylogaea oryzae]
MANLYQLLGEDPPAILGQVFSHGGGVPTKGGAMRQAILTATESAPGLKGMTGVKASCDYA